MMHSTLHANSARYLADRVTVSVPYRSLCSSDQALVAVPRINLDRFGRRAFSCAGPSRWNSLPLHLRAQTVSVSIRKDLKTVFNCLHNFVRCVVIEIYTVNKLICCNT